MDAPAGLVVIGGSAGAIESLITIVEGLPADFDAAVLVAIHRPASGETMLTDILDRRAQIPASAAVHGEPLRPGRIYLAPPDHHLLVENGHLQLNHGPRENGHRPAIDPLFRTAAFRYGTAVTGVVLSGTRDDGSLGLQVIRRHGGIAIVQDPKDALFGEMPRNAIETAAPQHVIPATAIAQLLAELAVRPMNEQRVTLATGRQAGDPSPPPIGAGDVNGTPTGLSCPECHGVIWASADPQVPPYRCRTGHAFSEESLLQVQSEALEDALWAAVRALQENASLNQALARRASRRGDLRAASRRTDRSQQAARQAKLIQDMLERRGEEAGVEVAQS